VEEEGEKEGEEGEDDNFHHKDHNVVVEKNKGQNKAENFTLSSLKAVRIKYNTLSPLRMIC
jgi:hypothetical protein